MDREKLQEERKNAEAVVIGMTFADATQYFAQHYPHFMLRDDTTERRTKDMRLSRLNVVTKDGVIVSTQMWC